MPANNIPEGRPAGGAQVVWHLRPAQRQSWRESCQGLRANGSGSDPIPPSGWEARTEAACFVKVCNMRTGLPNGAACKAHGYVAVPRTRGHTFTKQVAQQ